MMMMGGILLLLLLPLILVGLVIAFVLGLLGQVPDILDRLRAPDRPIRDEGNPTRHCTQCGQPLQRGWAFCPGCGVEVHWV